MNNDINVYMRNNKRNDSPDSLVKQLVCEDGFTMSVQASHYHYCSPRQDNAAFYYKVEIGFPSEKEEYLMPYAEDRERPTDTVYGYVPVEIVECVIEKHGGIKE